MADSFLQKLTRIHEDATMVGWDFSGLDGRLVADEPGWDFEDLCVDAMSEAEAAIDLGTGGGERLIALCERLGDRRPAHLTATEGWRPNVPVARAALKSLGVDVVDYDNESHTAMPFTSDSFDLVMTRHESYDVTEVARVLRPGGTLITQQVHGRDAEELRTWFGGEAQYPDCTLEHDTAAAVAASLVVEEQQDWTGQMEFADATALVEYMGLVPWDVPGFTVEAHLAKLAELDAASPILISQRRYWFRARHPDAPV